MNKIVVVAIALVLAGLCAPASAQPHRWSGHGWRGHGWSHPRYHYRVDPGTAFWGGVLGGVIGTWWSQSNRLDQEEARRADWLSSCYARYKSFDRVTGTYLGYDGFRHPCL
ncbi:MAG: BA14K family protein [Nitrososphaera sp.]|nr:BA14K family protein [Nitrososphaera sp.]